MAKLTCEEKNNPIERTTLPSCLKVWGLEKKTIKNQKTSQKQQSLPYAHKTISIKKSSKQKHSGTHCKRSLGFNYCKDWLNDTPTSIWGQFRKRSSFVRYFPLLAFRDVSGTGPEWKRDCGFRKKSSSCDKAAKMRLSILPNSLDSFFVALPWIFSHTWAI